MNVYKMNNPIIITNLAIITIYFLVLVLQLTGT